MADLAQCGQFESRDDLLRESMPQMRERDERAEWLRGMQAAVDEGRAMSQPVAYTMPMKFSTS